MRNTSANAHIWRQFRNTPKRRAPRRTLSLGPRIGLTRAMGKMRALFSRKVGASNA